ncbi:hypothetical protein [Tritonibacter litoralis]|nr:hypothetical protein [Tritonibacter litoralis]
MAKELGVEKAADRIALVLSVLFGIALMRKNFQLGAFQKMSQ